MLADLKGPGFDDGMYDAFAESMTAALAQCGVRSRILHRDPMELDEQARLTSALQELQPTAALSIVITGGTIFPSGGEVDHELQLRLVDVASSEVTWQAAAATFWNPSGERFAFEVISRLRSDGVLKRCPLEGLSLDACLQRRRGILSLARHVKDERKRKQLVDSAPACEGKS